ncbi:MAG: hypothetical protein EOO42_07900 [Flavobacteriales bacterium]|nr:MAG: hypothetical protein EOO42_07900 [Flavobacteriales bacterium]
MKYLGLVSFFIFFNISVFGATSTGCSDGDNIYPNFSGVNFYDCTGCPAIPIYNMTDVIPMRWGAGDNNCGIVRGNFTSLNKRCKIKRANGTTPDGAGLVSYETTNNSCPIDDYIPFLLLAIAAFGCYQIYKTKTNIFPLI